MTGTMIGHKQDPLHVSSEHIDHVLEKVDEALGSMANNELGMTDEEYDAAEKRLVRKLDFTLVPMVWLLYLFNYLDRNNIA